MKLYVPLIIGFLGIFAFVSPDLSFDEEAYEQERTLAVMRKIGHELLLSAGDKSSRVLPIERSGSSSYIIRFETQFRFETPVLVDIIHNNIQKADLNTKYIVNVMGCRDRSVYYSYEFIPGTRIDSLNCLSRENDFGCYALKITFSDNSGLFRGKSLFISIPLVLLSIISFIYLKNKEARVKRESPAEEDAIKIGGLSFNARTRILARGNIRTELTEKEARILHIFALRQNEIIERDQLLKEVWEDEGIFVSRSLDVFVSRLRKKLEADPEVNIVNVHGRGYRLEVAG
jgi:hypothetical protein